MEPQRHQEARTPRETAQETIEPSKCTERTHELMKHSDSWRGLPFIGWQPGMGRDLYELRNCPRCDSSLLRGVDTTRISYLPPELPA